MRKLDNTKLTRLVCTLPDDILLYDEDTMKNLIMNGMDIARVKLIDVN